MGRRSIDRKRLALLGRGRTTSKADDDPFLRELLIPFGSSGYVERVEIEDSATVTILAVRHPL
jgi:hypothetical protein